MAEFDYSPYSNEQIYEKAKQAYQMGRMDWAESLRAEYWSRQQERPSQDEQIDEALGIPLSGGLEYATSFADQGRALVHNTVATAASSILENQRDLLTQVFPDVDRESIDVSFGKDGVKMSKLRDDMVSMGEYWEKEAAAHRPDNPYLAWGHDLAHSIVQMAPSMAIGRATKSGNAALGVMGGMVYVNEYSRNLAEGKGHEEAIKEAMIQVAFELGPEKAFGFFDDMPFGKGLRVWGKKMLQETLSEAVTEELNIMKEKFEDPSFDMNAWDTWKRRAHAASMGAGMGGVFASPSLSGKAPAEDTTGDTMQPESPVMKAARYVAEQEVEEELAPQRDAAREPTPRTPDPETAPVQAEFDLDAPTGETEVERQARLKEELDEQERGAFTIPGGRGDALYEAREAARQLQSEEQAAWDAYEAQLEEQEARKWGIIGEQAPTIPEPRERAPRQLSLDSRSEGQQAEGLAPGLRQRPTVAGVAGPNRDPLMRDASEAPLYGPEQVRQAFEEVQDAPIADLMDEFVQTSANPEAARETVMSYFRGEGLFGTDKYRAQVEQEVRQAVAEARTQTMRETIQRQSQSMGLETADLEALEEFSTRVESKVTEPELKLTDRTGTTVIPEEAIEEAQTLPAGIITKGDGKVGEYVVTGLDRANGIVHVEYRSKTPDKQGNYTRLKYWWKIGVPGVNKSLKNGEWDHTRKKGTRKHKYEDDATKHIPMEFRKQVDEAIRGYSSGELRQGVRGGKRMRALEMGEWLTPRNLNEHIIDIQQEARASKQATKGAVVRAVPTVAEIREELLRMYEAGEITGVVRDLSKEADGATLAGVPTERMKGYVKTAYKRLAKDKPYLNRLTEEEAADAAAEGEAQAREDQPKTVAEIKAAMDNPVPWRKMPLLERDAGAEIETIIERKDASDIGNGRARRVRVYQVMPNGLVRILEVRPTEVGKRYEVRVISQGRNKYSTPPVVATVGGAFTEKAALKWIEESTATSVDKNAKPTPEVIEQLVATDKSKATRQPTAQTEGQGKSSIDEQQDTVPDTGHQGRRTPVLQAAAKAKTTARERALRKAEKEAAAAVEEENRVDAAELEAISLEELQQEEELAAGEQIPLLAEEQAPAAEGEKGFLQSVEEAEQELTAEEHTLMEQLILHDDLMMLVDSLAETNIEKNQVLRGLKNTASGLLDLADRILTPYYRTTVTGTESGILADEKVGTFRSFYTGDAPARYSSATITRQGHQQRLAARKAIRALFKQHPEIIEFAYRVDNSTAAEKDAMKEAIEGAVILYMGRIRELKQSLMRDPDLPIESKYVGGEIRKLYEMTEPSQPNKRTKKEVAPEQGDLGLVTMEDLVGIINQQVDFGRAAASESTPLADDPIGTPAIGTGMDRATLQEQNLRLREGEVAREVAEGIAETIAEENRVLARQAEARAAFAEERTDNLADEIERLRADIESSEAREAEREKEREIQRLKDENQRRLDAERRADEARAEQEREDTKQRRREQRTLARQQARLERTEFYQEEVAKYEAEIEQKTLVEKQQAEEIQLELFAMPEPTNKAIGLEREMVAARLVPILKSTVEQYARDAEASTKKPTAEGNRQTVDLDSPDPEGRAAFEAEIAIDGIQPGTWRNAWRAVKYWTSRDLGLKKNQRVILEDARDAVGNVQAEVNAIMDLWEQAAVELKKSDKNYKRYAKRYDNAITDYLLDMAHSSVTTKHGVVLPPEAREHLDKIKSRILSLGKMGIEKGAWDTHNVRAAVLAGRGYLHRTSKQTDKTRKQIDNMRAELGKLAKQAWNVPTTAAEIQGLSLGRLLSILQDQSHDLYKGRITTSLETDAEGKDVTVAHLNYGGGKSTRLGVIQKGTGKVVEDTAEISEQTLRDIMAMNPPTDEMFAEAMSTLANEMAADLNNFISGARGSGPSKSIIKERRLMKSDADLIASSIKPMINKAPKEIKSQVKEYLNSRAQFSRTLSFNEYLQGVETKFPEMREAIAQQRARYELNSKIREAINELTDPETTIFDTTNKIATSVYTAHFMQQVMQSGLAGGWASYAGRGKVGKGWESLAPKGTALGDASVGIPGTAEGDGSPQMIKGSDIMVPREVALAMREISGQTKETMAGREGIAKAVHTASAYTKMGKVIFNFLGHARNLSSTGMIHVFNNPVGYGYFKAHGLGVGAAAEQSRKSLSKKQHAKVAAKDNEQVKRVLDRFTRMGLQFDGGRSGAVYDLRRRGFGAVDDKIVLAHKGGAGAQRVKTVFEEHFRLEDEAVKVPAAIMRTKEYLRLSGGKPELLDRWLEKGDEALNEEEAAELDKAMRVAVEVVLNEYPTFSRINKITKGISRNLVVGAFPGFSIEMIRTSKNAVIHNAMLMAGVMPNGERVPASRQAEATAIGTVRLMAQAAKWTALAAIVKIMGSTMMDDDEEPTDEMWPILAQTRSGWSEPQKKIRAGVPWWQRDTMVSMHSINPEDGTYTIMSADYLMPTGGLESALQGSVSRILRAQAEDDAPMVRELALALWEGVEPILFSEEPLFGEFRKRITSGNVASYKDDAILRKIANAVDESFGGESDEFLPNLAGAITGSAVTIAPEGINQAADLYEWGKNLFLEADGDEHVESIGERVMQTAAHLGGLKQRKMSFDQDMTIQLKSDKRRFGQATRNMMSRLSEKDWLAGTEDSYEEFKAAFDAQNFYRRQQFDNMFYTTGFAREQLGRSTGDIAAVMGDMATSDTTLNDIMNGRYTVPSAETFRKHVLSKVPGEGTRPEQEEAGTGRVADLTYEEANQLYQWYLQASGETGVNYRDY